VIWLKPWAKIGAGDSMRAVQNPIRTQRCKGVLATTGQSPNFVMPVFVASGTCMPGESGLELKRSRTAAFEWGRVQRLYVHRQKTPQCHKRSLSFQTNTLPDALHKHAVQAPSQHLVECALYSLASRAGNAGHCFSLGLATCAAHTCGVATSISPLSAAWAISRSR
jgi:hypothetical protein